MRNLLKYFLQGLFLLAPVVITLYILYRSLLFVENIIPTKIPGLGILILISVLTLTGYLGSTILSQLFKYFGEIMEKIPFVKLIYSSLKDIFEAFVGQKKKFDKPVLVKMSQTQEIERIGFITQKNLSQIGIEGNKVAVYFPFSYAITGELLIVPAENVSIINASSAEVMRFIVSGGVTQIEDDKP
ncbi:MAG: DUF502 domain-containing protein [Bacteroidetes bacterium]|nr:DUF502 domain-containing protein [Bacteroidota bacterium]MBV6461367.1 hypothetical protein [Flavobacteriales bacterium]WKZ75231.1 MAG: DUF502 domain-containing protein [Vicingaceae bacterium]MCL4816499.1 DUF502 domain-containing protein [Flavobacteriales bacterium]NOG94405.1 DUF502 domain-containing protein [Bacteroidota bacterium]